MQLYRRTSEKQSMYIAKFNVAAMYICAVSVKVMLLKGFLSLQPRNLCLYNCDEEKHTNEYSCGYRLHKCTLFCLVLQLCKC